MQNEELRSYDFDFVGGLDNRYNFRTVNDISYNVRFKPGVEYVALSEPGGKIFTRLLLK